VEVGLKYFNLHVVHVIHGELKHTMAQGVRFLERCLDAALFGLLVLKPYVFEVLYNVLAL
jgi:hypothetical protein